VIEAGISNPGDIDAITTPAAAFSLRGSRHDWSYKTGMIDRPEYTRIEKPNTRGKVLGGSSCLNYFTWIPGSAATFDDWAAYGGDDWTWDTCKEYLYKVRKTPQIFENIFANSLAACQLQGRPW
jgi:choline dehydrogenase-like flavoprotein